MTLPIIAMSILAAPAFASSAAVYEQDQTGSAGAMSDRNAASWYQRAIERLDATLTETDDEFLGDISTPPRPEVRDLLARTQDVLALVESGSRREYSDFGLDHRDGFEMLLPHLGSMRNLTKLAAMDAAVRLHDGDGAGAAARIASIYRASSHMADDRTLISSLVGVAKFTLLDTMTQQGIESAAFTRADAAVMHESMKWIDPHDPFGLIDSLMTEQAVGTEWMERKFDEGPREFVGFISSVNDIDDAAGSEDLVAIGAMGREEFAAQIDGYDRAMSEIVEAFHSEDAAEGRRLLAEIDRAVRDGEFGVLARVITPSIGNVYDRLIDTRALVANRLVTLEDLASGAVAPEQLANAATWYLRAAARIEMMRPEDREALRAAPLSAPVDESIEAILDDVQDALTMLEQGSKMRRCDFAEAGADVSRLFMPEYLPALRDGIRLLILDSARRRMDGRGSTRTAVERLATALRMAAHLDNDDRLLSAAVAHEGFRLALDFAEAPERADNDGAGGAQAGEMLKEKGANDVAEAPALWDEWALEALREAAGRVGHGDPFRYIEAVERLRAGMADRIVAMAGADSGDGGDDIDDVGINDGEHAGAATPAPIIAEVEAMLADYDVNQLLYVAFVLEATPLAPGEADAAAPMRDSIAAGAAALAPLLNVECLEIARIDASAVRPLLEKGRIEALSAVSTLPLSNISADREAARRDLRRALRLFAPPAPPVIPGAADG